MSINAFIAQGHGRSTDGSSNQYPAGWEVIDAILIADGKQDHIVQTA